MSKAAPSYPEQAIRWQARYDEAMDQALAWQQRYIELRKEHNKLLDVIDKNSQGKHKASPSHPNTMIGRTPHGARDSDPEGGLHP